jgi:hypothetical protein
MLVPIVALEKRVDLFQGSMSGIDIGFGSTLFDVPIEDLG